ncbi:hypothetical protein NL676_002459 [Syzygium grande]|nr:hypothetical protein NL676_002459 [Syzygium grande]
MILEELGFSERGHERQCACVSFVLREGSGMKRSNGARAEDGSHRFPAAHTVLQQTSPSPRAGALSTPAPYSQGDKLMTLLRQRKMEASSSRLLGSRGKRAPATTNKNKQGGQAAGWISTNEASQSVSNEDTRSGAHLGKNPGRGAEERRSRGRNRNAPWRSASRIASFFFLLPLLGYK